MEEFNYFLSFTRIDNKCHLMINLKYDKDVIPVFNRIFDDNMEINKIYDQIFEYLNHTIINATKNELVLFYNAFRNTQFNFNPAKVNLINTMVNAPLELTPKEMLFLMYIHSKGRDSKKAKYWVLEYHLDIDEAIDTLINLNYLTTHDYYFNMKKSTKKELIQILDDHHISYSGNKPEILDIVKNSFNEEELDSLFKGMYFKQTIKGDQIAKNYQDLNDFHKSYYRYANQLKIEEYFLLKKHNKDLEAKDVCKIMVDKKNEEITSDFDWNKFFEEEVKTNKEIIDFAEVIKKYTTHETRVETKDVSNEDFLNVVFNQKIEKKEVLKTVDVVDNDEEFFKILKIGNSKKMDFKEEKISNEDFFNVINSNKKPELIKEEHTHIKFLDPPKIEEVDAKTISHGNMFFKYFIYSSVLSPLIVYILYKYIFG